MREESKLQVIEQELDSLIHVFGSKRNGNKKKALVTRMSVIGFSGAIPILLGLEKIGGPDSLLNNFALVLGVLVTVIIAYEGFFDHRSLWIRMTLTLARLRDLQLDLKFQRAGLNGADPDDAILLDFRERIEEILNADLQQWVQLRTQGGTGIHEPKSGL